MRSLTINTIQGTSNSLEVAAGSYLSIPGSVVQTIYVRTDARSSYSSATSGNGTTITDLGIEVAPRGPNNLLIMTWMINAEIHHDNVFLIHKNGNLITDTGYEGYNSVNGNVRYSGVMSPAYDQDYASTPSNYMLQYFITAGNTVPRTYAPAIRGAGATAYTLWLNRPVSSAGADNYEVTISTGVLMEIAQ